jgi:DNA-binding CsgD family transcriptional regulator
MKRRLLKSAGGRTNGPSGGGGGGGGDGGRGRGSEGRTVALLRDIQSGAAGAQTISIDDRRQIVAYLVADGYSNAEIAQMLKVSDRSIERDKRAIREGNALPKDPRLVSQLAGRLVSEAELSVQRIRRTSRDKVTPPAVKVDAEHRCFQILSDLVQRLQGLGYLPSATQRIEAELLHHVDEIPSLECIGAELNRLAEINADGDGRLPPEISQLQAEFQRATIAVKVQRAAAAGDERHLVEAEE